MGFKRISKLQQLVCLQNTRQIRNYRSSTAFLQVKPNLTQAVTEAEKIVGYPTSFLNLRWLLTDELANIALHIRKLIGINHPLLDTARKLFMGTNGNMPAWGLIVLLVAKSCGLKETFSEHDRDISAGVLYSQRALAEVTEMIRTSILIHKTVENLDERDRDYVQEFNFGNKIALLSGDFLLSKSFNELAFLRNSDLNELMSSSLRDLVEADFMGIYDEQSVPLPSKPLKIQASVEVVDHFGTEPHQASHILGYPVAEWTLRSVLGGATLLAKSCRGALILAHHSQEIQKLGFLIGKNIALAWQAKIDQEPFLPGASGIFSLVSAPVMVHLKHKPDLYDKLQKGQKSVLNIDYEDVRKEIQNGPGLKGAQELQQQFSNEALNVLNQLPESDARTALENIIKTM